MRWTFLLSLALVTSMTSGCFDVAGTALLVGLSDEQCGKLHIPNLQKVLLGIVDGAPTDQYPAVGLIVHTDKCGVHSYCTGTFVSGNTMLSASHCLGSPNGTADMLYMPASALGSSFSFNDLQSKLSAGIHPSYVTALNPGLAPAPEAVSQADSALDLSLLVFASAVAPATATVRQTPTVTDTPVSLVGYGRTDLTDTTATSASDRFDKRVGTNTVYSVTPSSAGADHGSVLTIIGAAAPDASAQGKSVAAPGDSGGPLLAGDVIIGVASSATGSASGHAGSNALSNYCDVSTAAAQAFFSEAKANGAVVNFATGN